MAFIVSREVLNRLCHPEKKDWPPLKPEDRVAYDSFTGETMILQDASEFFAEKGKTAEANETPSEDNGDSNT